jgi:hypothetical protein
MQWRLRLNPTIGVVNSLAACFGAWTVMGQAFD